MKYDIFIPINKLSIQDQKRYSIIINESNKLKYQKKKYYNHDIQYQYHKNRQYISGKVGKTAKPININRKRLLKENRYKGFNLKDIDKNGKVIVKFN